VASTFAIFLDLKATDSIRNIVSYNNLPVVLAGSYAGLSDSYDGASHQAILDLAILRVMPNLTVVVPADAIELQQALVLAVRRAGPTYVRICRNPTPVLFAGRQPLELGRIRRLAEGHDLTIAVCGVPTFMAIAATARLARRGLSVDLLEVSTIKPMDLETLVTSARKTGKVLTVEEHSTRGGLGGAVAEALACSAPVPIRMLGIEDQFAESGEWFALLAKHGLSTESIEAAALGLVRS
jgi:transketolase